MSSSSFLYVTSNQKRREDGGGDNVRDLCGPTAATGHARNAIWPRCNSSWIEPSSPWRRRRDGDGSYWETQHREQNAQRRFFRRHLKKTGYFSCVLFVVVVSRELCQNYFQDWRALVCLNYNHVQSQCIANKRKWGEKSAFLCRRGPRSMYVIDR